MLLFKILFPLFFIIQIFWSEASSHRPQLSGIEIDSPVDGEVLQGVVTVSGTTDVPGFISAEIAFGYAGDPTSTWFLIHQSKTPVDDDVLASWDTSMITDGDYRLRVQVFLSGGQILESIVENLRVRNYSLVETETPASRSEVQATRESTKTPVSDYQVGLATPTVLPTNSIELTTQDLLVSAAKGVAVILIGLVIAGIYIGLRFLSRGI